MVPVNKSAPEIVCSVILIPEPFHVPGNGDDPGNIEVYVLPVVLVIV